MISIVFILYCASSFLLNTVYFRFLKTLYDKPINEVVYSIALWTVVASIKWSCILSPSPQGSHVFNVSKAKKFNVKLTKSYTVFSKSINCFMGNSNDDCALSCDFVTIHLMLYKVSHSLSLSQSYRRNVLHRLMVLVTCLEYTRKLII